MQILLKITEKNAPVVVDNPARNSIIYITAIEDGGTTTLTYAAPAVINGETVNVGLVVQFTSAGRPHAVNVGLQDTGTFKIDMEEAPRGTNSRVYRYDKGTALSTMGASADSVTDIPEKVNSKFSAKVIVTDKDSERRELTKRQQEYFKDGKVRDEDGNLKVMYHGTNAKFTVYNRGQANGWHGKGIYFAENKSYAKENGRRITVFYPIHAKNNTFLFGQINKILDYIKIPFLPIERKKALLARKRKKEYTATVSKPVKRCVMMNLLLAILSSTAVAVCMRFATEGGQQRTGRLAINYLTCTVIAYAYMDKSTLFSGENLGNTPLMSLLMGILYLAGFLLFQREMSKSGIVLSSIFMKLGLLVPVAASVLLFRETPTPLQGIGFLLAVVAIVLINMPDGERDGRFHGGLLLLLLSCGSGDLMSKVFEEWGDPRFREVYLTMAFGIAMLLCVVITVLRREKPEKKDALYGVLLGIPNYYASRFLLLALKDIPAVVVYPTFSVGTLAAVTTLGIFLFRERLHPRQWVAFAGILLALLLLNI